MQHFLIYDKDIVMLDGRKREMPLEVVPIYTAITPKYFYSIFEHLQLPKNKKVSDTKHLFHSPQCFKGHATTIWRICILQITNYAYFKRDYVYVAHIVVTSQPFRTPQAAQRSPPLKFAHRGPRRQLTLAFYPHFKKVVGTFFWLADTWYEQQTCCSLSQFCRRL
jgi:hypothetical protein